MFRCVLVCFGIFRNVWVHVVMFRYVTEYFGGLRHISVYLVIFRYVSVRYGRFCTLGYISALFDVSRHVSAYYDIISGSWQFFNTAVLLF